MHGTNGTNERNNIKDTQDKKDIKGTKGTNSLFITFEGIEGSGKSTQMTLLASYLSSRGYDVTTTREPGGTPIGEAIRAVLLNPDFTEMDYRTEVLLYAADRAQHVAELVKPALARGSIVISDRYLDSTIAYQHYGRGLPLDFILEVNEQATEGIKPDLTLLLTVPVEIGLKRATKTIADRIEREDVEFHERVEKGFQELAKREPERWRVIDGMSTVDEIHTLIIQAVEPLL
ncbi:MAG: dTMP kinase [Candidatus Aquicultor secundus]|uniref:Thymidylate kinase n=1 Tax=Candidatus Aquicultor secundus TaxID=1973895 RepID=A0A2M7T8X7_9ACTN|nr:dTMP kinase [Candidatus Aquicultor secundus]NCO66548.1 dTMP kinase [Solirubrobacter sp.]OIO88178.1 MAG: dTMP kinase [Candidatus Aquicultor secundus]PIU25975.1 MAG: dTMP kinase [Candidatus Aquicultor secundus]PIW22496.1 MAG: dTMP kinase [Candidatus Aquicultor secundus]PIX51713.1 MAG: dTMP kinase [Candidatus Aquicultor secundus]